MNAKSSGKWHYVIVAFVFLLSVTLSILFLNYEKKRKEIQTSLTLASFQEIIELNLKEKFNYTQDLAVVAQVEASSFHFEDSAKKIMQSPGCVYVGLMEGTTLTRVYPNEGMQQQDVGKDIKELDYAYTLARLTKNQVVEGPVTQGNQELFFIIQPLFTQKNDGMKTFTGETVAALDSKVVIESLNLKNLHKKGYEYELWRMDPLDGRKKRISISSNKEIDFSKSYEVKIELPTVWTLSTVPTGGWYSLDMVLILAFASVAVTVCFALSLYLYKKKKLLERIAESVGKVDAETGFLNRKSLIEELNVWTEKQEEPFALIYVVLDGYNRMMQLCTQEQKNNLIEHIILCFKDYVQCAHVIARLGECNFILAVKETSSAGEIENLAKGLSIELIRKFEVNDEKIVLTADSKTCQFPKDGTEAEELLQKVMRSYYAQS